MKRSLQRSFVATTRLISCDAVEISLPSALKGQWHDDESGGTTTPAAVDHGSERWVAVGSLNDAYRQLNSSFLCYWPDILSGSSSFHALVYVKSNSRPSQRSYRVFIVSHTELVQFGHIFERYPTMPKL